MFELDFNTKEMKEKKEKNKTQLYGWVEKITIIIGSLNIN